MPDIPDRDDKEAQYARLMAKLLKAYGGRLLEKLGDPPDLKNLPADFWDEEAKELVKALSPFGEKVYLDAARQLMRGSTIQVDWDVVNESAATWSRQHTGEWLAKKINDTTRDTIDAEITRLREEIPAFFERQMTRGDLERRLQENGLFGPVRAEMIAVTEVTRAAARGEDAIAAEVERLTGIKMVPIWNTDNDELVCEICEPLNQKEAAGKHGDEPYWIHPDSKDEITMPAHPRCRCFEGYELPRGEEEKPEELQSDEQAQHGPDGKPVSESLDNHIRGRLGDSVEYAIDKMDSVHGDGNLPNIPINQSSGKRTQGKYKYMINGKPIDISISKYADGPGTTTLHEIGHFIDHQGIGKPGKYASETDELLKPWAEAVKNTDAYQNIYAMLKNPKEFTTTIETDYGSYKIMPDTHHLGYLASTRETFARSYAQYIAEKTGDPLLLAEIEKSQSDKMYGVRQWSHDDFKPVASAFDDLFKSLGWQK